MPVPLLCDCGRRFEAPAAGSFAACPSCGRDVAVPKAGPPEDVLFLGDPRPRLARRWRWWIALAAAGGLLAAIAMPVASSCGEPMRRSQCVNNLKQIGLALHDYHEAYGSLPPAAVVGQDGRPLLSWRVLILPFLDSADLYKKFRLDEPWDSPHNRPLLAAMPWAFACPSDPTLGPNSGLTGYQVVVGPDTAFPPDFRPVRFDDITDGTAGTLLVGEAARPVPWTKPDDLRVDDPAPLVGLGSRHRSHRDGFHLLFADGMVQYRNDTIRHVLRYHLTRAGGEAFCVEQY